MKFLANEFRSAMEVLKELRLSEKSKINCVKRSPQIVTKFIMSDLVFKYFFWKKEIIKNQSKIWKWVKIKQLSAKEDPPIGNSTKFSWIHEIPRKGVWFFVWNFVSGYILDGYFYVSRLY